MAEEKPNKGKCSCKCSGKRRNPNQAQVCDELPMIEADAAHRGLCQRGQTDDTFVFAPDLAPFDLPPYDEAYDMGLEQEAFDKGSSTGACLVPPNDVMPPCARKAESTQQPHKEVWLDEDELIEILGPAQANYGGP